MLATSEFDDIPMDRKKPLIIASRQSPLAQRQAYMVRDQLGASMGLSKSEYDDHLKIETFLTKGDKRLDGSLAKIGGKGLFTKEIEQALLIGAADIAVHSMKDMPSIMPDGLKIGAIPPREQPFDAFICETVASPWDLPQGAVLGTSSVRRAAQALNRRPDLQIVPMRGNVGTRLGKLAAGEAAATFLAEAGLNRLDMHHIKRTVLDPEDFLPAVSQGVLCVQIRDGDDTLSELLQPIHCRETALCSAAERAFLEALDGSCQTPIAGLATFKERTLHLRAQLLSLDGKDEMRREARADLGAAPPADCLEMAQHIGQSLAKAMYVDAPPSIRELVDRA